MATRVDAANELEALKAQLADFALRNAAETIARDPKRFLSSDLMKAIEASAIAAVEARLAREPRPSPEDFAEQVLVQIRPELTALMQGAAADRPRAGANAARRERGVMAESVGFDGLARELRRHWAALVVAFLLIAAAGGAVGYFAGMGVGRADALRPAAPTPSSESVDLAPAAGDPKPADAAASPAAQTPPATAPAGPTGAARPKR